MEYHVKGLNEQEVEQARQHHGSNILTSQDAEGFWEKLLDNFKDPMIIILVAALGIVLVLAFFGYAEWYEGIGIAAAVILATFVATMSEFKNEQTFQKLQEEASRIRVNVFRDERARTIHIDDVVTGDCILLQPGNKIPADGKVIHGELQVNQAVFTGEAIPDRKRPGVQDAETGVALDNPHCVFRGTTVEDGEGVMAVDRVGDKTRFGKLAGQLKAEDRKGPLRVKLAKLARESGKQKLRFSILTWIELGETPRPID